MTGFLGLLAQAEFGAVDARMPVLVGVDLVEQLGDIVGALNVG